jgi:hypothetical protein
MPHWPFQLLCLLIFFTTSSRSFVFLRPGETFTQRATMIRRDGIGSRWSSSKEQTRSDSLLLSHLSYEDAGMDNEGLSKDPAWLFMTFTLQLEAIQPPERG